MLLRFLFGDDVFISYSRRDGANYAAALANELSKRERGGFSCFLSWLRLQVAAIATKARANTILLPRRRAAKIAVLIRFRRFQWELLPGLFRDIAPEM